MHEKKKNLTNLKGETDKPKMIAGHVHTLRIIGRSSRQKVQKHADGVNNTALSVTGSD
jgi:hypothetical protein